MDCGETFIEKGNRELRVLSPTFSTRLSSPSAIPFYWRLGHAFLGLTNTGVPNRRRACWGGNARFGRLGFPFLPARRRTGLETCPYLIGR